MEGMLEEALIEQLTSRLSSRQRAAFHARVGQLLDLPDQDTDLAEFLTCFANLVAELFAAGTVAIWFRLPHQAAVTRKVDVGWSNLSLDPETDTAHERLIAFAVSQNGPLAVKPFSAPWARAGASNPTDSYLLLAPVQHQNEGIALIELALGPKPLRLPQKQLMESYLSWLDWLTSIFGRGMERRFAAFHQPLKSAILCLDETSRQVETIQEQIRHTIEGSLQRLAGENFGSLVANQTVAKQVHALLESKGLRVQCPECGAAAILRCQKVGNAKTGAFVFDHYLDTGRTFHGGPSTFPRLVLVPKPPRRTKR